MGLLRRIGRALERAVKSPLGAFALGGATGLYFFRNGQKSAQRAVDARGHGASMQTWLQHCGCHPGGLMTPGGVGGFAALASTATSHRQLAQLARLASRSPAWQHPVGRANMSAILAANHARISFQEMAFAYA